MSEAPHVPRSLLLQWHVTERCNLRCAHCYQEDPGTRPGPELRLAELLAILEQFTEFVAALRRHARPARLPVQITLTGGEPFVRGDFLELLAAVAARHSRFSFAILTNGSFIDAARARELRRLRPQFVQVSVEGDRATHDRIRGAGTFDRTVAAIRALRGAGIHTLVSFTAHRANFREFPAVVRLGRELGVNRVWADRLIPTGHGGAVPDLGLTPAGTREFFQMMAQCRAQARGRCEVALHRALQFLVGGGEPYACAAGDRLITLLPDGSLCPCRRLPIVVGNVRERPLADLYQGSELFRRLRDPGQAIAGCEACCYAQLCRGGLRCLAYAVHGDPFRADPGCWAARQPAVEPSERRAQFV